MSFDILLNGRLLHHFMTIVITKLSIGILVQRIAARTVVIIFYPFPFSLSS